MWQSPAPSKRPSRPGVSWVAGGERCDDFPPSVEKGIIQTSTRKSFLQKNLNSDDHLDRFFSLMAKKGKLRNQSSNKRKKKMNPLTQLKKNRGERAGTYKMKKNRSILMAALVSAVLLSMTAGALP
ncbi:MAG TPA: hypothetical protein VFU37_06780, partial [Pyrinomonadaceae bacterium]|nr:hypothetical protein [Pyrinomonadaceae bacterium]